MRSLGRGVLVLGGLLAAAPAAAQPKSLHWRALAVDAELDADGRLNVRERHDMVFTGDWNGGERRFDLRKGQALQLRGIRRIGDGGGASSCARATRRAWTSTSGPMRTRCAGAAARRRTRRSRRR